MQVIDQKAARPEMWLYYSDQEAGQRPDDDGCGAGQAIVAAAIASKNFLQVSVLDGDYVGPSRQRLPGAGPAAVEQPRR